MSIPKSESDAFEAAVTEQFSFLENDFTLSDAGSNTVDEDPRDSYVVAKYRHEDFPVDIAWNPFAMSLGVLVRLSNDDLGRRERYVYFEPFVEFISEGSVSPLVPQIYPGMSVGKIEKTMKRREQVFENGFGEALCEIARRLQTTLTNLQNSPVETIRKYQEWYQSRGKAA